MLIEEKALVYTLDPRNSNACQCGETTFKFSYRAPDPVQGRGLIQGWWANTGLRSCLKKCRNGGVLGLVRCMPSLYLSTYVSINSNIVSPPKYFSFLTMQAQHILSVVFVGSLGCIVCSPAWRRAKSMKPLIKWVRRYRLQILLPEYRKINPTRLEALCILLYCTGLFLFDVLNISSLEQATSRAGHEPVIQLVPLLATGSIFWTSQGFGVCLSTLQSYMVV